MSDQGEQISTPGYQAAGWHAAGARSTVYAALVADHTYEDPFYSENMKTVPKEQFQVPWWYRSDFTVNDASPRSYLNVTGVLSATDVYVNGTRIATADRIGGIYPVYELDITPYVRAGLNSVAFLVQPNDPTKDLTTGWIDWAPGPADNNMGLSQDITVRRTGAVALDDTHLSTTLDPCLRSAELTVKTKVRNESASAVTTTVSGTIGDIRFGKDVTLAPHETKQITFAPADTPQLRLADPRIWWPAGMGDQPLYDLRLEARAGGTVTDTAHRSFGIRDVRSSLNKDGNREYFVNGHRLLIRGAGESTASCCAGTGRRPPTASPTRSAWASTRSDWRATPSRTSSSTWPTRPACSSCRGGNAATSGRRAATSTTATAGSPRPPWPRSRPSCATTRA